MSKGTVMFLVSIGMCAFWLVLIGLWMARGNYLVGSLCVMGFLVAAGAARFWSDHS